MPLAIEDVLQAEIRLTDGNGNPARDEAVHVQTLGRGFAWLDTGTSDSMADASNFIGTIIKMQGVQVAALEEISFRKGWINAQQLLSLAQPMSKNEYGKYLIKLATNGG